MVEATTRLELDQILMFLTAQAFFYKEI